MIIENGEEFLIREMPKTSSVYSFPHFPFALLDLSNKLLFAHLFAS